MLKRLQVYAHLMRLHKPIGIFLLLWPTLWALWLAGRGNPDPALVLIFIFGVIVMRSAGCVINDIADRHIDGHVARTRSRPLASGLVTLQGALILFTLLMLIAASLAWQLNRLTLICACIGAGLAMLYPFLKRYTHLPQVGLGVAYTWSVPMAFAAQTGSIPWFAWFLFGITTLWPIMYDTQYAMADREDDLKIGVKSTAILFGHADRLLIGMLQITFLLGLIGVGLLFHLQIPYYYSLAVAGLFFIYQQRLMKDRRPELCLKAFLNNQWVGLIIFLGIGCS